jgi:hypothetical protein
VRSTRTIDYTKPIIIADQIAGTTWSAKYIGVHPTTKGWHEVMADGSIREVDADGYIHGPLAALRVQNSD